MGLGPSVLERLNQDELAGVVDAAGPLEPEILRLGPGRLGEVVDQVEPPVGPVRLGLELDRAKTSARGSPR